MCNEPSTSFHLSWGRQERDYFFQKVYLPVENLVKRQSPARPGGGAFPLSRSRQFPPPEELEESEYVDESDEAPQNAAPAFRGRQPSPEEDYPDDQSYTEAPKVTTPAPTKPTSSSRVRFAARPRFGSQAAARTTSAPKSPATAATRGRATPAQSQRLDVVANILNNPPPPRPASRAISRTASENADKKPEPEVSTRRTSNNQRVRTRGRLRTRTSSTTTTTTTTTTQAPPEDYYYYYEDDEDTPKNQPIATTTSTTTTTTTTARPRSAIGRPRPSNSRGRSTSRPVIKFDPESQFAPPPEEPEDLPVVTLSTKRFTTSSTTAQPAGAADTSGGGIPAHLRSKYRPRKDGRFIDFLRDPNRPRELKGFDLTDYPFYVVVPDDIDFDCDDRKDGYYASVPHKCQLFHYCFAGARYDFLCANYTLYDQTTFTCRFANNVDCESSAKYYYRNDDLWKETTPAPTEPPRTRPPRRDRDEEYDYDDEDYDDEYEEERRRRPPKRRRNRRKNRRKYSDEKK
ncbi:UNVERIFIED_CONTAM: hypothetical protein NCL1_49577 [Trichonephila clavipes]